MYSLLSVLLVNEDRSPVTRKKILHQIYISQSLTAELDIG